MRQATVAVGLAALCWWTNPAHAGTLRCPPDSVKVGNVCIDTYEASIWQIPPDNIALVRKVQQGKATVADLTAAGATELSCDNNYPTAPANFPLDGNWTPVPGSNPPSPGFYAVSIAGVKPSVCITWFQANQACLLSGKRLLTNREWQGAAAGTPDPGDADDGATTCATLEPASVKEVDTGSRSSCKSSWGVFDMVGNASEWVADWADQANGGSYADWTSAALNSIAGADGSAFGGTGFISIPGSYSSYAIPAALVRGGAWFNGTRAGVFAVDARYDPSGRFEGLGFRCAR
jgi:formylglycine-generating enzyme required for sulfatase activity